MRGLAFSLKRQYLLMSRRSSCKKDGVEITVSEGHSDKLMREVVRSYHLEDHVDVVKPLKRSKKSLKTGGGEVRLGGALVPLFREGRWAVRAWLILCHFLRIGSKGSETRCIDAHVRQACCTKLLKFSAALACYVSGLMKLPLRGLYFRLHTELRGTRGEHAKEAQQSVCCFPRLPSPN